MAISKNCNLSSGLTNAVSATNGVLRFAGLRNAQALRYATTQSVDIACACFMADYYSGVMMLIKGCS